MTHRLLAALMHAFLALSVLAATEARAQGALDRIQATRLLKVAVPLDIPPFGSVGDNQQPLGLDVDMAQIIASKLGVKLQLVPTASSQRIQVLLDRKVDLIVAILGKSPEREKVIDFAGPYSTFNLYVFGPRAKPLREIADLAGQSIAVTKGSIQDQELTKAVPAGTEIKRFDENGGVIAAYSEGKVQFLASGLSMVSAAISRNPQFDAEAKFVLKESPTFVGVPKGEEALRERIDKIIEEARSAGELRKLSAKWFSRAGLAAR